MKNFLFYFFTVACWSQAPTIEWSASIGGLAYDDLSCIIQTTHNNDYVVIGSTNSIDGDIISYHGASDVFMAKISTTGALLWTKTFGGTGTDIGKSICETPDGGFILCGSTTSTDSDITFNHGYYDAWVLKLNANGDIEWQKTYGGTAQDESYAIKPTPDGGYIVGGITRSLNGDVTSNNGESDYWVIKIDSVGTIAWQKNYGGSNLDVLSTIEPTTDGGYIISGNTFSTNGDVIGNHGGSDYWLLKINSNGAIEWQKTLGGSGYEFCGAIKQTNDGGFIVTGSTPSVDGEVTISYGQGDFWVVKLDSLGTLEWQKSYGGTAQDSSYDIHQTIEGGYIIAGLSYSHDIDLLNNIGLADYWVLKINATGVPQWQNNFGGSNNDYASYIQQTDANCFIVGGRTYSSDFDVSNYHGNSDIFLLKLAPENLSFSASIKNSFSIYPNPTSNLVHLHTSNNVVLDSITVTDMVGKVVLMQVGNTETISTENLSAGVYLLEASSGGKSYKIKFIKQ